MPAFADPSGESPPPSETSAPSEGESLTEATEALEDEEREQAEWLLSPEARLERESSQDAYSALSSAQAQDLLLEAFPQQLQELNADPARVLSEMEVERILSTYGALVSIGDGESAVVESSVPIQSDLGGEGKEPVDLALEPSGDAFVPQNPLSAVELPGSASDPLKLGGGVQVELPGGGDHDAELLGNKNLFLPETDTDTDTLVAPIAGGAEVFEQLRSPESPEEFRFPFSSLPAGAKLVEADRGGAEVISASGEMLEEVPAPSAVDAQGTPVPVTMSVEDDSLVIDIAHRSADVAYPLLLDPRYNGGYESPALNSSWIAHTTGPYGMVSSPSSLLAYSQGSSVKYDANTYGQWEYTAPGETAYIENASFSALSFYINKCASTSQPHGYVGIFNVNSNSYVWPSPGVYAGINISNTSYYIGGGGPGTRKAVVGVGTGNASASDKCAHELWVGGVTVQENDPEAPTIKSVSGIPSNTWFDPAKAGSATVSATDPGFGISLMYMGNLNADGDDDNAGCNGMWNSRCLRDRTWTTNPPYKEGIRTFQVTAEDPTGKAGAWTTTTQVDATKPNIDLEGQLAEVTKQEGTEEKAQELGDDKLRLSSYNLKIKATDGNPKGEPKDQRSGVKDIAIFIDGKEKPVDWEPNPSPCTSCEMVKPYTLDLSEIEGGGVHKLVVIATDQVGLKREREIEFEYFPATGMKDEYLLQRFPLPSGEGNESEEENPVRPELAVNVANGNLVYRQKDVEVTGQALDLEVERFYNSQLPESANTEWGDGWTLAQTPTLELEGAKGSEPPSQAPMVRTSGALEGAVGLPTKSEEHRFDAKLQALVTKESNGGYEVADESGKSNDSLAFDASGKVTELRTPGYARVDYSYEGGDLSEIAVEDPASSDLPPEQRDEGALELPVYGFTFGASGTGDGQFSSIGGIATDPAGYTYVADSGGHRVERFDRNGAYVSKFGSSGTGNGQFGTISGIGVGPDGSIYVADNGSKRIEKFNSSGEYLTQFGKEGTGTGQFAKGIGGLAVDGAGNVYASDPGGKRILKFSASGQYLGQIADPQLTTPYLLAANAAGELWAVDWADQRIEKFNAAGAHTGQFSNAGEAQLAWAQGIAVDEDSKTVWTVDAEEGRAVGFSENGAYLGQFDISGLGTGSMAEPNWLAIGAGGNFYIANSTARQVQKWVTPTRPKVTAETAGSVVETSATLNATVDPRTLGTQYRFEWGPTTAYGNSLPLSPKGIGAGAKAVKVSEKVEGLKPWVLYHSRVVATNAEGTAYGEDQQFTTWGEWSLESPPLPKASTSSSLSDVSCTSAISCVAVGYDSYTSRMVGETWNGTKWTLTNGSADQKPISVSCGSGVSCWAVGTQNTSEEVLLEHWEQEEGTWWRAASGIKPILPEGGSNLRLNAIACTSATECTAVGGYTKEGQSQPVAERLAGNKFTLQTMPAAAGATLTDIACSSAGSCVAIGSKLPKGSAREGFAVRWNGTAWSTLSTPGPKAEGWAERALASVSCGSATSCKATGRLTNEEGETTPYALSYNGSEFSLATLPTLKAGSSLASMSCTSASACLAVGHAAEGGTLAVGWDGSAWTVRSSLTPKEKTAWLNGVSCVGSLSCTTVGKQVGGGETTPLAERVGEIWTLESPPLPKVSNSSTLADVACPSALSCIAVGTDTYAGRSLGETWNGEKWTLLGGEEDRTPTSISCGTSTTCWSVGTKGTENAALVEFWEGYEAGQWEHYAATTPIVPEGGSNLRLSGISCTGASECTAVGYYTKEGQTRPLAERLANSKWTVQSVPMPEATGAWLTDLSCSSASSCLAIGYKQVKGVGYEGFSVRWNGTEWSTLAVPKPAKSYEWRLSSVSCPSAGSCVAVGYRLDEAEASFPIAFAYDGNVYSASALPIALKAGSSLLSVSCAAVGNCLAVGRTGTSTLALGWSGSEWTLRSSPSPKEKTSTLRAVSCLAPLTCTAVGQAVGTETTPLAVRVELRNQVVSTASATSVAPGAATLNGTVNPHGLSTQYSFEYGPTTAYGKAAPAAPTGAGSGIKDVLASNAISGLEAGRLYHFRIVATSEVGTTYGQDRTFTTPPPSYAFAFGSTGSGEGQFKSPAGVATDAQGSVYVADAGNHRIVKFNSRGGFVSAFGKEGSGESQFTTISAIAVGPEGYVYVADSGQRKIKRFKGDGGFVSQFGAEGSGNGQFGSWIGGLAVGKEGVTWVSDSSNHRLERFDATGKYLSKIGTEGSGNGQFAQARAIAIDGGGNAWVIDLGHERVEQFSTGGTYLRQFGKLGKGPGELSNPLGLAVDAANNVWVTDSANNRIQEFNPKGEYVSQFGEVGTSEGQFYEPRGLAIDSQGSLLINNNQGEIQKWFVLNHDEPVDSSAAVDDDPSVEISTPGGLVESVEGDEVEEITYAHDGQMLTAVDSPGGDTEYEYDASERLTKVTLANGTWGKIDYDDFSRVKAVTVRPAGGTTKTTYFNYTLEPSRRTVVSPEGEPAVTYDIGEDGSVLKWWNAVKAPEIEEPLGGLYTQRGEIHPDPITFGDQTLLVQAHSEHGISSIEIVANGNQLVDEKTCAQDYSNGETECVNVAMEWVTSTESWPPGILNLEILVTDSLGQVSSMRFWVNIPRTPPPGSEAADPPKYAEILRFREAHGLDLDIKDDEMAINERIFGLISAWHNPNTPAGEVARATEERWGVPLRSVDAAELDWRLTYWAQASTAIPAWAAVNASSTFAGAYLDERAGGKIVVGFTGSQSSSTFDALQRTAGLIAGADRIVPMTPTPQHTLASLRTLQPQVSAAAGYPAGLIKTVFTDVPSNSIQVGASNVSQAQSLLQGSFGVSAPISVHFDRYGLERKDSRQRITGPVRAGDEILMTYYPRERLEEELYGGPCTSAFGAFERAKNPSTGESILRMFDLTAGHCAGLEYPNVYRRASKAVGAPQKPIGEVRRWGWADKNDPGIDVDAAAIRLKNPDQTPRWINQDEHLPGIRVTSVWSPTMSSGATFCFSGRTSEEKRCGPVISEATVSGQGNFKTSEMCFEVLSQGGDSGSPVWVEGTGVAVGILTTGSQDPDEPGWRAEYAEELKEEAADEGEKITAAEIAEATAEEERNLREESFACFNLLKPPEGADGDGTVFGDPYMAPLHLVTATNAQ